MYCGRVNPETNKEYADNYSCTGNSDKLCPIAKQCEIETNISNAYTHGNGIYDLGREELAYKTKNEKMILPIGTLVTYEDCHTKELKMGVIAEDDRGNSKEDLSDLNYCIITPETNWNWDKFYMDHHTCIVKVHGMAQVLMTFANDRANPIVVRGNKLTI